MNKETLGQYMKLAGILLGTIGVIILVTKYPLLVLLEVAGAGLWFLGKFLTQN